MEDKVVVITGASRGLGKAIAENFSLKGAKVVISGRNKSDLDLVSKEINALPVVADVTKEDELFDLVKKTILQYKKIDIWINNAGIWLPNGPVEDIDIKRAHEIFEVNLFGTIYSTRAILPHMKKQGYGIIINIISTSALQGRPNQTIYSASKHAEKGFTDSLREELKDTNIKIIGIYPGGIKTNLFDEKKPKDFDLFMTPESIAQIIVENLEKQEPETEIVIRRPGQK